MSTAIQTMEGLFDQANSAPKQRVAIACAGAHLPMEAAKSAVERGWITPIFVGDQDRVTQQAGRLDWDISTYALHHAPSEEEAGHIAAGLCGAGEADLLMKGHIHTDVFMKTALARDHGLRDGARFVHLFVHFMDERIVVVSDAAVNVSPDLETRKDATKRMVALLTHLGHPPRVAFLSATESAVASVPSALEAKELCDWASMALPDAEFAGPVALDWILSEAARREKGLDQVRIAGRVNGIIVPEIITGNTLSKALVYLGGSTAGGIVMGAKVPILLNSRADSVASRLTSLALARSLLS